LKAEPLFSTHPGAATHADENTYVLSKSSGIENMSLPLSEECQEIQ
jgi:hypothetical protein